jgi:hypothetical protein
MIRRYVGRTDGRAFVLFTSYEMMRRATRDLTAWLTEQQLALYSQSEGMPRHQMLEQFKNHPRAVLFGTDSFWQGVDVPGEALQNVIITKLPFSVPDHPLLQARLEAIRRAGRNPFVDYQLPEAAIKLRQGFGRLIRSQQDHGIVVLLDPRVAPNPTGGCSWNRCRIARWSKNLPGMPEPAYQNPPPVRACTTPPPPAPIVPWSGRSVAHSAVADAWLPRAVWQLPPVGFSSPRAAWQLRLVELRTPRAASPNLPAESQLRRPPRPRLW